MKKYGVAGARIDMGHALPAELERMIISEARKVKSDAFLLAEELGSGASIKAAKAGYDAIIGDLWAIEPHWQNGGLGKTVMKTLPFLKVPVLASAETPDTPRTLERKNGKQLHLFSAVLNYFLPGSIPFINSGFEMFEVQPLNKGLDSADARTDRVPVADLNYGKLGFFDLTALHWDTNTMEFSALLKSCAMIASWLVQPGIDNPLTIKYAEKNKYLFAFTRRSRDGERLLIVANPDFHKKGKFVISGLGKSRIKHDLLISVGNVELAAEGKNLHIDMGLGSVGVYQIGS